MIYFCILLTTASIIRAKMPISFYIQESCTTIIRLWVISIDHLIHQHPSDEQTMKHESTL